MPPSAKSALTPRQRRFVEEYLVDTCAARAARACGFRHPPTDIPAVKRAIQEAMDARAARAHVRADEVLLELKRLAGVDPLGLFNPDGTMRAIQDIPVELRHCIASFEVEELWEGRGDDRRQVGVLKKVKLWSKDASLDKLMRHLSLYKDKLTIEGSVTLRDLLPAAAGGVDVVDEEDADDQGDEEPTLEDELFGEG